MICPNCEGQIKGDNTTMNLSYNMLNGQEVNITNIPSGRCKTCNVEIYSLEVGIIIEHYFNYYGTTKMKLDYSTEILPLYQNLSVKKIIRFVPSKIAN